VIAEIMGGSHEGVRCAQAVASIRTLKINKTPKNNGVVNGTRIMAINEVGALDGH
jgi:hypothetical protein